MEGEKMIYIKIANREILEVTDTETENFQSVDKTNLDDTVDYFQKNNLKYDELILQKLENIFSESDGDVLEDFDIKVSTENRSFNELADMFNEGDIIIPDVQRKFVWDTNKCSKIIESILMGLPIPPLFFMDKGNNRYEVIDGLQRLTAISNFILGNSWGSITNNVQRNSVAKLSLNVDTSIRGNRFIDLSPEQQKKIKRATVTVIDFRQISPNDEKSKYLIFERINTGSELLNTMQIRKALAYGTLMSELYEQSNQNDLLKSIFGKQYLNKDRHVEFLLGVYVTYQVLEKKYELKSQYQKFILNDYCETNKNSNISQEFMTKFSEKLQNTIETFTKDNLFKKVNTAGDYHGNRNNNIADVFLATAILENANIDKDTMTRYKEIISKNIDLFAVNKVNKDLLDQRYEVCKKIFGVC